MLWGSSQVVSGNSDLRLIQALWMHPKNAPKKSPNVRNMQKFSPKHPPRTSLLGVGEVRDGLRGLTG